MAEGYLNPVVYMIGSRTASLYRRALEPCDRSLGRTSATAGTSCRDSSRRSEQIGEVVIRPRLRGSSFEMRSQLVDSLVRFAHRQHLDTSVDRANAVVHEPLLERGVTHVAR